MSATIRRIHSEESPAQRAAALQKLAREAASEHINEGLGFLHMLAKVGAEIAEGGEAYPPGVRDLFRRVALDARLQAATAGAIMERVS